MKSYDSKNNTYVGFKNYIDVFTRDDCFNSLKLAGYYIVASFIQLAMALYFATILCFKVRGSSLFKGLIFFPYLISGIAIGFIFKFFYTRGFRTRYCFVMYRIKSRESSILVKRYKNQQCVPCGNICMALHGTKYGTFSWCNDVC